MNRDEIREQVERIAGAKHLSESDKATDILGIPTLKCLLALLDQAGGDPSRLAVLAEDQEYPSHPCAFIGRISVYDSVYAELRQQMGKDFRRIVLPKEGKS